MNELIDSLSNPNTWLKVILFGVFYAVGRWRGYRDARKKYKGY